MKRNLSAVLWLFAGWYVGNFLAAFTGADQLLGPALGALAAVFVAGDPFHLFWPRPVVASRLPQVEPA